MSSGRGIPLPQDPVSRGILCAAIGRLFGHGDPAWLDLCILHREKFPGDDVRALLGEIGHLRPVADTVDDFFVLLGTGGHSDQADLLHALAKESHSAISPSVFEELWALLVLPHTGQRLVDLGKLIGEGNISNVGDAIKRLEQIREEIETQAGGSRRERFPLLDLPALKALTPEEYLVDRAIVSKELNVLYGPSGAGKTFIALSMALSIATGRPWLGHPVRQGIVVYVAGEGQGGIWKRVRAWLSHNQASEEEVSKTFFVIPEAVHALLPGDLAAFHAVLRRLPGPPALVVLDTLTRSFAGGNPNDTEAMANFVEACGTLQRELGCAVLVIAHTRKADEVEAGNHALRGAAAAMLLVSPCGRTLKGLAALRVARSKLKDDETEGDIHAQLFPVEVDREGDGKPVTSCAVGPMDGLDLLGGIPPAKAAALRALVQSTAPEEWLSCTAWEKACGKASSTFHECRAWLLGQGYVAKRERGSATLYQATPRGRTLIGPKVQ